MIRILREENSPAADAIEAEFRDLVLAYDRVLTTSQEAKITLGQEQALPAITDGERVVSGEAEVTAYFKELRKFVSDWRLFQGDFCYVNDDGDGCL